jgi:hypothetical protein
LSAAVGPIGQVGFETRTNEGQNIASTMDGICDDCARVTKTFSGKDQAVVTLTLDKHDRHEATA